MEKIDSKLLQGPAFCLTTGKAVKTIMMTGATTEIVEKNGRKVNKSTPWERQAKEEDVLSFKDYGEYVAIGTNDGKKFRVNKKGSPAPVEDKKK